MGYRRSVIDGLSIETLHNADLIGDAGCVGKQVTHPGTALSMPGELEGAADQRQACLVAAHRGQALSLADFIRQLLALHLLEHGLVIEEVHLGWAAALEEVDDALGPGGNVRGRKNSAKGALFVRAQQVGESYGAEPHAEALKEAPPAHAQGGIVARAGLRFHVFILPFHDSFVEVQENIRDSPRGGQPGGSQLLVRGCIACFEEVFSLLRIRLEKIELFPVEPVEDLFFAIARISACQHSEHLTKHGDAVLRVFFQEPLAEDPCRFYELRVVHQHQGLQGGGGSLPPHSADFALGCIQGHHDRRRGRAFPEGVEAAAVESFSLVPLQRLEGYRDLVGAHWGTADLSYKEPAGGEGVVADNLRGESVAAPPGQEDVLRIFLGQFRGASRVLAVGRGGYDGSQQLLNVPAAVDETQ